MQLTSQKSQPMRRIKLNLRENLKIKTKGLTFKQSDESPEDSPSKKRLRKASINLKSFNNIDIRKEKSIKQGFEDRYEIQEKIGQGGHSVVYRCKCFADGKHYAVKVTRKNDPENLESLKEQYRILAAIDNQSILQGYYLFLNQKKSTCYLVCQYYDYPNLRQYLVQHKNQAIIQHNIAEILKKIISAIYYLHEQKVCHRDLKPQNILYDQTTGQIKIIDFQVAKMPRYTHERLQMWTKAGTPTYRSPQLLKGSYNELTDMWSIGIVAYELLTRKFPFTTSYESNMYNEIKNYIPNLAGFQISQVAKNFLTKLLKNDPRQRMTARQALSHPFLLLVSTPVCGTSKKLNRSFVQEDDANQQKDEEETESPKSRFYDQNVKSSFFSCIDRDIGIRFCEE